MTAVVRRDRDDVHYRRSEGVRSDDIAVPRALLARALGSKRQTEVLALHVAVMHWLGCNHPRDAGLAVANAIREYLLGERGPLLGFEVSRRDVNEWHRRAKHCGGWARMLEGTC